MRFKCIYYDFRWFFFRGYIWCDFTPNMICFDHHEQIYVAAVIRKTRQSSFDFSTFFLVLRELVITQFTSFKHDKSLNLHGYA